MIFVGERLKNLRKINKLTQLEVANYIGVTKQAVSAWENNISIPESLILPNLAKYFKVEMSHFFVEEQKEVHVEKSEDFDEFKRILQEKQKLVDEYNALDTGIELKVVKSSGIKIVLSKVTRIANDEITIPSIVEKVLQLYIPGNVRKLKVNIECNLESMHCFFRKLDIDELDVSSLDITKISSLNGLFAEMKRVDKLIGLDKWDMTKVKSINGLFRSSNIKCIEGIDKWDTSKIENFTQIFMRSEIDKLDLNKWDLSSMITTDATLEVLINQSSSLFQEAKINKLYISNWNTSKIQRFINWFGRSNIEYIDDISKWDVSNGINFKYMFNRCKLNNSIDISNWNVNKGCITDNMFDLSENIEY